MKIPTDLHEQTSVDLEWYNLFRRQKDPRGLVHTIVCKGRSGKERWKASKHRQREEPHPKAKGCPLQSSFVFISTSRELLSYSSIYSGPTVRFSSHPRERQSSRPEILARAVRTEVCCFHRDAIVIQDWLCQWPSCCHKGRADSQTRSVQNRARERLTGLQPFLKPRSLCLDMTAEVNTLLFMT